MLVQAKRPNWAPQSHSCHSTLENLGCKMKNMALTDSLWASSPGDIEWFLEKHESWKILPWSRHLRSVCASLEVSFSGDCASWRLIFFKVAVSNFETGVSQSLKFTILYLVLWLDPRGTGVVEGRGEGAPECPWQILLAVHWLREGDCACLPLVLPFPPPPPPSLIPVWQVSRSEMPPLYPYSIELRSD